jgi:hypothetical protein
VRAEDAKAGQGRQGVLRPAFAGGADHGPGRGDDRVAHGMEVGLGGDVGLEPAHVRRRVAEQRDDRIGIP